MTIPPLIASSSWSDRLLYSEMVSLSTLFISAAVVALVVAAVIYVVSDKVPKMDVS